MWLSFLSCFMNKEDNKQKERDILKNNILSRYNIPLIRLTTNGSREENIIRSKLDEIVNNNINIYIYLYFFSMDKCID